MTRISLFEVLLPDLRAYSRSIADSQDEAEDLVQDAIERAIRAPSKPDTIKSLRPWMFRVIRNLRYDDLRKRRVRKEYMTGLGRLSQEMGQAGDHARDVLVRLAFQKLPPETREILFLVDVMGLSYAEMAEVLDVPKGTVMSKVSRARRLLLGYVEGSGADQREKKK